jgi:hypothetical protein
MKRRYSTVAMGAVVTLVVGVVGTLVPLLGNLFGPVAGGLLVGVRSPDDQRLVDGFAAGLFGGVGLATALLHLLVERTSLSTASLPGPSVGGVTVTAVVVAAAVCGALAALTARFHTGRAGSHPAIRDGT